MVLDWWHDENYSHGFLIPFVSGYLIYKNKKALKEISHSPSWFGPVVVTLGLMILIIGIAGAELFTMRFSFIVVLAGLLLSFYGKDFFKKISFPLFFLIFMVPLPYIVYNSLTLPLRAIATRLASSFLYIFNVPALREGNVIYLPETSLEVVEACSGIRSLISLLALGTFFAYLFQPKFFKRIILVIAVIPITIVANALRITLTGILSFHVSEKIAHGFFHYFSGWLIFLVALFALIILNWLLERL